LREAHEEGRHRKDEAAWPFIGDQRMKGFADVIEKARRRELDCIKYVTIQNEVDAHDIGLRCNAAVSKRLYKRLYTILDGELRRRPDPLDRDANLRKTVDFVGGDLVMRNPRGVKKSDLDTRARAGDDLHIRPQVRRVCLCAGGDRGLIPARTLMAANDVLRRHCQVVSRRLAEGKVIPFLGAGASLVERPAKVDWRQGGYLPSGSELADYFARSYEFPEKGPLDLVRVSQYVELAAGDAALFEELHAIFAGRYEPNKLHRLIADLPAILRRQGHSRVGQLVITTNYDDALERAFADADEQVDVVSYAAEPNEPGGFVHVRPEGERVAISKHTDYHDFELDERSVILKIHGAVDRADEAADSYVITEDHYIDYLARENISKLPAYLMARMRTSHFLFLGYGMRDWNLRVILRHIWSEQTRHFASWAIQLHPGEIDTRFWERHGVDIVDAPLEDWVDVMREGLE
jgi:SIR2-like domain